MNACSRHSLAIPSLDTPLRFHLSGFPSKAWVSHNTTLLCLCVCACMFVCAQTSKLSCFHLRLLSRSKISHSQVVSIKKVWRSIDTTATVCGLKFVELAKWPWGEKKQFDRLRKLYWSHWICECYTSYQNVMKDYATLLMIENRWRNIQKKIWNIGPGHLGWAP